MPKGVTTKERRTPVKWEDGFYIRIYELARAGLSKPEIAQVIGTSVATLDIWEQKHPALKLSLKNLRNGENRHNQDFRSYVYDRLPDHLKQIWDQLEEYNNNPNATRQMELMLRDAGKSVRQHLFLYALVKCNFNPSEACKVVNITRKDLDYWCANDPEFSELIQEMHWHKKNFCEASLMELVRRHDTPAVIFANKTLNRETYGDKLQVDVNSQVKHEHSIKVDELPLELRLQLLAEIRKQKQLPNGLKEIPKDQVIIERAPMSVTPLDNGVPTNGSHEEGRGVRTPHNGQD